MKSAKEKFEIFETIVKILDDSITEEEFRLFEKQLAQSEEVRSMYMTMLESYAYIQRPGNSFKISMGEYDDSLQYQQLLQSLAKSEKEAPAIEMPRPEQQPELIQKVVHEKVNRRYKKTTLFSLFTTAAAILLVIIFARFAPVRQAHYGQVIETYQPVFTDASTGLQKANFLADEPIKLEKGLLRIQMDDGSIVLLEGPSELRLEADDQVFLVQGKLTASVPKSAIGFTVRTPSASIVDYGTEFGVSIDQYAKTEAHVLRGNVEMRLGSNLRVFDKAIRLSANQAASASGRSLNVIPADLNQFTYEIPSPFENYARSLNPILYFRLKDEAVNTFCETTDKNGLEILTVPVQSVTHGPFQDSRYLTWALRMDAQNDVQIRNVMPLFANETGDFTVGAWIRFDKIQKQTVWSHHVLMNPAPGNMGYYRVLWLNDQGKLEHTAYFPQYSPESRMQNTVVSDETLKPDQWYFVTVTHAKGNYKSMYINGRLSARSQTRQPTSLEKYSELTLGRSIENIAPGFSGAMAEILFFNRELTQKENLSLYESAINK